MQLRFTKMHGLGNDFMVIDATREHLALSPEQIRQWADRRFGIGFDQLLLVESTSSPGVDFRYRIFNADGGEVEQCGNGARCFVQFVHEKKLSTKSEIVVETRAGIIRPKLLENGLVCVDMGIPKLSPKEVPFLSETQDVIQDLDVGGQTIKITVVSMGNPHAVQVVNDLDFAPVASLGARIEQHPRFPARVNAGFMQIMDSHHIRLRVFERGAGETLACGTGACAAVVAGILRAELVSPVQVETRGGTLSIAWQGPGTSVVMTGPATTVYEGTITMPDSPLVAYA